MSRFFTPAKNADRDRALRQLLQDTDPAANAELPPADVERLRRQVLAAAEERQRQRFFAWMGSWQPALAAAGLAALVVLALLLARQAPSPNPTLNPEPRLAEHEPTTSAPSPGADPTPPTTTLQEAASQEATTTKRQRRAHRPQAQLASMAEPGSVMAVTASAQPAAHRQQQIQFQSPGGTRIIWLLNSELVL